VTLRVRCHTDTETSSFSNLFYELNRVSVVRRFVIHGVCGLITTESEDIFDTDTFVLIEYLVDFVAPVPYASEMCHRRDGRFLTDPSH
jgi:hypothetical protein